LGTGTLSNGKAAYTTSGLTLGSHSITASYAGDSNYNASASATLTQTVKQASSVALASSANPSTAGIAVVFTATVTPSAATGTVTFKDGATTLGTGTLSKGVATYSTSALAAGSHSIIAVYGGNSTYAGNTSSALAQNVVTVTSLAVNPANASLPLNSQQQFTAMATRSDGSLQDISSSVTWSVTNTATATIAGTGLLTAATQGQTSVQAAFGSVNGSTVLTVTGTTFRLSGSLQTARVEHTATLLQNGKVLIVGGQDSLNRVLASAELYDPTTGNFTPTGSLSTARLGHTATLLQNGKVLIAGGLYFTGAGPVDPTNAELYDPAAGTFSFAGTMTQGLSSATATLLPDGRVFLFDGSNPSQLYDPTAQTFTTSASPLSSLSGITSTLLTDGTVLAAGGAPTAELYQPASGTFVATGNLNTERSFQTATRLNSGKVLIAGGSGITTILNETELYDPSAKTFATSANMSIARDGHSSTLLNNGSVLIVGGQTPINYTGTAELYNPSNAILLGAGSLTFARASHTATLLANGAVLIVGGTDQQGRVLADSELYEATPIAPYALQVTPATVTMQVGETQQFTAVDNHGDPRTDVTWTVSNSSLASINGGSSTTLTALAIGQVTLTANAEGVTAQAQVNIVDPTAIVPGTALWSAPPVPGFYPLQIAQAVPTGTGPELYSIQLSADGTQSVVQGLTADGQQMWQSQLPVLTSTSVPDGFGGLIVTQNHTCLPGQTNPMAVVDLDATTGKPLWQIVAPGVQQGNTIVYCYPDNIKAVEPQIAVRPDGAVVVAAMTNNGLPALTVVAQNGQSQTVAIPTSTSTNPSGQQLSTFSPMGPPIVDSDGSIYVEYEVRQVAYPPKITSAVLYLLQIAPPTAGLLGPQTTITLSSTTQDENLYPGRIIPDGQGGLLATWTISPSNPPPPPAPPNPHTYEASHVVGGAAGAPYDLPFNPHSVTFGEYPTVVLGENGVAFAKGRAAASDGSNNDADQIVSFNLNSGASNWSYQASTQAALSIIEATSGGGLTVNDTDPGVIHFDTNGNPSATVPFLQGARPFDFGSWVSVSNGTVDLLWSPNGANGILTTLAQSVFPMLAGNAQGQHQPPFCQRSGSNCVLAPNSDSTSTVPPGVTQREVIYEVFSLQNGALVGMGGNSQILQTKIAGLETNPTNPNAHICDWNTPATKCETPSFTNTAGWYTDDYNVGSGTPNTVTQQFFVDRGQVRVFWPTDVGGGKTWYGAWSQQSTTDANKGGIIQQNNPDMQHGATCTLHPPDPHGCSPTQANGTN
jgi:hypothetical protein